MAGKIPETLPTNRKLTLQPETYRTSRKLAGKKSGCCADEVGEFCGSSQAEEFQNTSLPVEMLSGSELVRPNFLEEE
jgi:hypothetical protein